MTAWMPEDNGLYGASLCPWFSINPGSTVATGRICLARMKWSSSKTIQTLYTHVDTAGVTLTSGQNLMALYDGSGNLIASTTSADQSSAWTSTGVKTVTLGAAVTIARDPTGFIYGACLVKGTTPPIFRGMNCGTGYANIGMTGALAFGLDASTGNTSMPSTLTPSTMTALNPWFFAVGP